MDQQALDHCDGSLIVHADGWIECTAAGCADTHEARHEWLLACVSLWAVCPCGEDDHLPAEVLRASAA